MAGNDLCSTHFSVHNSYIFVTTIQFLFCFSLGQGRQYIFEFFVLLYTNFRFCFQIWPPCHRIGRLATYLAAVPQIWPPCHTFGRRDTDWATHCARFGSHATDLAAVPQIWPLCHRFGRRATDLAAVPQTWRLYPRLGHCAWLVACSQNTSRA